MKWYSRRAAAVVLAAALFLPSIPAASAQPRERGRDVTELVLRIISKVKRAFGVSANGDHVTPPTPAPAPPPPPTTT